VWKVTTPFDFTVQSLREQLPVFRDYEYLKWCDQTLGDAITQWSWGDDNEMLVVTVGDEGRVHITRGPDPGFGCY
jgi:hypothetical protein